jgi:hypothetical protein
MYRQFGRSLMPAPITRLTEWIFGDVGGVSLSNCILSEAMGHSQLRQTNGKILLEIMCISIVEQVHLTMFIA